jgi:hypothetical protein
VSGIFGTVVGLLIDDAEEQGDDNISEVVRYDHFPRQFPSGEAVAALVKGGTSFLRRL